MERRGSGDVLFVKGSLVYETTTPCGELPERLEPKHWVAAILLDTQLTGEISMEKMTANNAACRLHVSVKGQAPMSDSVLGASDLMKVIDAKLMEQGATFLRGQAEMKQLKLRHIRVRVYDREYQLSLQSKMSNEDSETFKPSTVLQTSGQCEQFSPSLFLQNLMPRGLDGGEMLLKPHNANTADRCNVGLDVVGMAPLFASSGHAFDFLRDIDKRLDTLFASTMDRQSFLKPSLHKASFELISPRDERVEIKQPQAVSLSSTAANAPTKSVMLGILVGISFLCGMLFYVNHKRRAVEKRCQERYNRASQAAQIRRVSIRMGYDRVAARDPRFEHEEEEEKDNLL